MSHMVHKTVCWCAVKSTLLGTGINVSHPHLVLLLIAVMDGKQGHWQIPLFKCLCDSDCCSLGPYRNCQKWNSPVIKSYLVHWVHFGIKTIEISFDKHFLITWTKLRAFRYQYERHEETDCEKRHKKKKFAETIKLWVMQLLCFHIRD